MLPDNFFTQLMENEGIYSDDKADSGGKTIYGISRNNFPNAFDSVMQSYNAGNIDEAKQKAKTFYEAKFWNPLYDQINKSNVQFRLFDFGVNAGKNTAVKLLQQTLNNNHFRNVLDEDGIFGTKSLLAINAADDNLYDFYNATIESFYRNLVSKNENDEKFLQGWLNRLGKLPA